MNVYNIGARSEMWAFKGKYFWRISRPGRGDFVESKMIDTQKSRSVDCFCEMWELVDINLVYLHFITFYLESNASRCYFLFWKY